MEYIEITKEKALAIIEGARDPYRKLWVVDESAAGTVPVYVRAGEIRVNCWEEDEDVLVSKDEMQSCTWWLGEDGSCCVLEARGSDGAIWIGGILGKPGSKEYIHSLVGGPAAHA